MQQDPRPQQCRTWTRLKLSERLVLTLPDGTEVLVRREGRAVVVDAPAAVKVERR